MSFFTSFPAKYRIKWIKERKRGFFLFLSAFFPAGVLFWILFWNILPEYMEDPLEILQKNTPARCWYDRHGSLVKRERTWQYQWRLPLKLSQISPEVIKVILAAEDANFYKHGGVDISAVFRASFQNISSGRIISGASTIPMQLAALAMREKKIYRRSLKGKILQALMARKLVKKYPRNHILEEYLNQIPFGGNIYGIGAASLYYFGLPASQLNIAEASLLCGIPQRPAVYRADRNFPLARKRQKRVLQMLEKRKFLRTGEGEKIYRDAPLRMRDFSFPSTLAGKEPRLHNMFFRQAAKSLTKKNTPLPLSIHTTLDQEMTRVILNTLKKYARMYPDIKDAAAVLIENDSMEIRAYIGTLDIKEPYTGQVDASIALRSAGSTLKPFLYGEAINGGTVTIDTFFLDAPLQYKDYEPKNYDGTYRGKVTLEEALLLSLNTCAVKMLELMGEKRILELFDRIGLPDHTKRKNGLSLALGSAGYTLLELTNAFTLFPNEGIYEKCRFIREKEQKKKRVKKAIWHKNTALAVNSILRRKTPPFAAVDAAWKTGTSNGNHDAWCLAATSEYTLGVWFGNKDGKPSPHLVGIEIAAPCAAAILESLYRSGEKKVWEKDLSTFETILLCGETALKASPACKNRFSGRKIKGIPLRMCAGCSGKKVLQQYRILSPKSGNYFLPANRKSLSIPLISDDKEGVWVIDGIKQEKPISAFDFTEGPHCVTRLHASGKKKEKSVSFQVMQEE